MRENRTMSSPYNACGIRIQFLCVAILLLFRLTFQICFLSLPHECRQTADLPYLGWQQNMSFLHCHDKDGQSLLKAHIGEQHVISLYVLPSRPWAPSYLVGYTQCSGKSLCCLRTDLCAVLCQVCRRHPPMTSDDYSAECQHVLSSSGNHPLLTSVTAGLRGAYGPGWVGLL